MNDLSFFRIFVAAFLLIMITGGSDAVAVDSAASQQTLKGIQGVYVLVENLQPHIQKYALKSGLTEDQLQNDIGLQLKETGIKVLSRDEWMKTPGSPVLYVCVNTHETEKYWYAYDIRIELQQIVSMESNPKIKILAGTWLMNVTGIANIGTLNVIRNDVLFLVDRFIQAYKAVNSKR